jgi:hypothetical protein
MRRTRGKTKKPSDQVPQDGSKESSDWTSIFFQPIRQRVDLPLDLHGGSGIPPADLQAAVRLKATDGLLHCETTLAATAACMTKDGNRLLRKVRRNNPYQTPGRKCKGICERGFAKGEMKK